MHKFFFGIFLILIVSCDRNPNTTKAEPEPESLDRLKEICTKLNFNNKEIIFKDSINPILNSLKADSSRIKALKAVSSKLLLKQDSMYFLDYNRRYLKSATKNLDSINMGLSCEYMGYYYMHHNFLDSAYFYYDKSDKIYENIKSSKNRARVLLNLAIIQKNIKDYTGSEINTFKALRIFERYQNHPLLYSCYNNLGIIYNELKEYSQALKYHKKAEEQLKYIADLSYKLTTINNIGVVYQRMGKFSQSIKKFLEALKEKDIIRKDAKLYAMLLDNLAYSKFLQNPDADVINYYKKALCIRDSIKHTDGTIINKLHLGKYYLYHQDTLRAKVCFSESYILSKENNDYRDLLSSLLLLSQIEKTDKGDKYKEYIRISDSLHNEERILRNKFARISYETAQFIAENKSLSLQKKWGLLLFSAVLIVGVLVYIIRNQHVKNKELKLIREQQLAHEEILELKISSQRKLEEGREKEKQRISRELHDGILSKLFGLRLNLELLNSENDLKRKEERAEYLSQLKELESEIRDVSHELNKDQLLEEVSFLEIIKELTIEQEGIGKYTSQLLISENIIWVKLINSLKLHVYRIIQEALFNISKYAGAEHVIIKLWEQSDYLYLEIIDDGKGFSIKRVNKGIGLKNMQLRTKELKGDFKITSGKKGTKIEVEIPL